MYDVVVNCMKEMHKFYCICCTVVVGEEWCRFELQNSGKIRFLVKNMQHESTHSVMDRYKLMQV